MKSIVLLSGGIDSTVVLHKTLASHGDVEAVTFNYGQVHIREQTAARNIAEHYGIRHTVIDVSGLLSASALTGDCEIPTGHANEPDVTYVPARNIVFLAAAAGHAERIGAGMIAFGANADDSAGYPDCRPKFVESFREVLLCCAVKPIWLAAPLLAMTKAQIISWAISNDVPLELTWSCYRGGDVQCGNCGACESNRIGAKAD